MSNLVEECQVEGIVKLLFSSVTENGMSVDEFLAILVNADSATFKTGDEIIELQCCQTNIEEMRSYDEDGTETIVIEKVICSESVKRKKII